MRLIDLSRRVGVVFHGPTADRLATQVGDKELPRGRPDLVRQRGGTHRWVKSTLRAAVELGDVLRQAVLRIGMLGIDGDEPDQRSQTFSDRSSANCGTFNQRETG